MIMQTKNTFLKSILFSVIPCISILLMSSLSAAKVPIVIGGFQDDARPIAIAKFNDANGLSNFDFSHVIASDLASSGEFEPKNQNEIVDVLVTGELVQAAQGYMIQMNVFDAVQGRSLFSYKVPSNDRMARAAAHHLSDVLYEKLTGVKGIFSTRVAYINVQGTGRNRIYELVVSDVDGENQTVITRSPAPIMSPAWSPDARRLAYVSFESGNSQIYVQDLATGGREVIAPRPGVNSSPAWSPDGTQLAITQSGGTGNLDIYIVDLQTGRSKQLTRSRSIDTEATWSEDGQTIYFTSDRAGQAQIYQVSSRGGEAKRVTFTGKYNARPRVSADGKSLSVVHLNDGKYQIGMVNRITGQVVTITNGRLDESPSVSPNGKVVIYSTKRNRRGSLAIVRSDGSSKPHYLSTVGDVREPAWSPYRQ